ncbi:MAG: response regulator transcription factor [Nannocystaceae bacterium]
MANDASKKILVIEDDASVRTLLDKSLSARGYAVTTCDDGLAGLTTLERTRPDLIIVDIMMPRLDGMTFVKAIKGNAATRPIPVIFLTANNDPKTMIAGINLGAKHYITKPFAIDELLGKVAKVFG